MDEAHSKNTCKLYRYDAGLNASVMLDHICLPNGLVWSIDGSELFFVDSVARTLFIAPAIRSLANTWSRHRCLPIHRRTSAARMGWRWTRKGASGCASSLAAVCSGTIATAN